MIYRNLSLNTCSCHDRLLQMGLGGAAGCMSPSDCLPLFAHSIFLKSDAWLTYVAFMCAEERRHAQYLLAADGVLSRCHRLPPISLSWCIGLARASRSRTCMDKDTDQLKCHQIHCNTTPVNRKIFLHPRTHEMTWNEALQSGCLVRWCQLGNFLTLGLVIWLFR